MEFDEYARHHRGPLLRFATTLAGDPRLAEEIVQDVLLRAFQRWDSIGELERPHAYVRRMVVNQHCPGAGDGDEWSRGPTFPTARPPTRREPTPSGQR